MSISVIALVWDRYPGGGSKLLTMLALADWAGEDGGRIFPSMSTLAQKIRMSERQATRIVHDLVKASPAFLIWTNPENRGGRNTTNRYRIDIETLTKCQSFPPDISVVNPDKSSVNPDIAMSPYPLEPLEPLKDRLTSIDGNRRKRPPEFPDPRGENKSENLSNYIKHIEGLKNLAPEELLRAKNELAGLDLFPESFTK